MSRVGWSEVLTTGFRQFRVQPAAGSHARPVAASGWLHGAWYTQQPPRVAALLFPDPPTHLPTLPLCCSIDLGGGEKLESSMWQDGPFGKLGPGALTPEELSLVAARVALASTYLSLEATLTGCLWLPVGTSAAGILTAILLARGSSGGGGSRS